MSTQDPSTTPQSTAATESTASTESTESTASLESTQAPKDQAAKPGKDPLRGSRTSGIWVAVVVLVVLLVLLAVFVLQNTQKVSVSFFGWNVHAPLAATLLIATAAGGAIVVVAGALRILQLRRRVRRTQKS